MREEFNNQLKLAMKAGDRKRVDAIRMINAALKDKDIEARGEGKEVTDAAIVALLEKMVKSRRESLGIYEKAGRTDLAEKESSEINIIQSFLPKQLSEEETEQAVDLAIKETGAAGINDMGKVVAALRTRYTGQMDFARVGALAKAKLSR